MKVEKTYLNVLLQKLLTIDNTHYKNIRKKDGKIGERFVKDSIKYYFWEKSFKLQDSGNRIFDIEGQFGSDRISGDRGIDFRFAFMYNYKQYNCFVEVKNWKIQKISKQEFNSEILDRFINYANLPNVIWILTMHKGNISKITKGCQKHNIHILPMDRKIVTNQLNIKSLTPIMEHFLDGFDTFMSTTTGVNLTKIGLKKETDSKPYDRDIKLGMPPELVANRHNTTVSNIQKRKSDLKSRGRNIIDGRSKTARLARLLRRQDI